MRCVEGLAPCRTDPADLPGRRRAIRPEGERNMVGPYHFLGIVHDLLGIVAYTMVIFYYAIKLYDLTRRKEDQQV